MLSQEWEDWVIDSVKKNFNRESLMLYLTRKMDQPISDIEETFNKLSTNEGMQLLIKKENIRPELIDVNKNFLEIDDKIINIVMSCDVPRVILFENVLSNEECDELIAIAEKNLNPSHVVDVNSSIFNTVLDKNRTSSGYSFRYNENKVITNIENRLAKIINWPVENGEPIQLLRYEIGQEYKPHFDWFDPNKEWSTDYLKHGGQRVGTFIMYLSNVENGGTTIFSTLGLQIYPKKGSVLFFSNVNVEGIVDARTKHAGMPVINGVKYIATKWLRESAYITNKVIKNEK